jgi:hypothetical protein
MAPTSPPTDFDPQHNPWQTLSSAPQYQNPWIRVREDQVLNPKGGAGIYGVVSMRNKAIGIIPIDADGNTWLVGQYRYTLNEYCWEIPMGGGPLEVDILESAQRELREETGLLARTWTRIARLHTSNSRLCVLGRRPGAGRMGARRKRRLAPLETAASPGYRAGNEQLHYRCHQRSWLAQGPAPASPAQLLTMASAPAG